MAGFFFFPFDFLFFDTLTLYIFLTHFKFLNIHDILFETYLSDTYCIDIIDSLSLKAL